MRTILSLLILMSSSVGLCVERDCGPLLVSKSKHSQESILWFELYKNGDRAAKITFDDLIDKGRSIKKEVRRNPWELSYVQIILKQDQGSLSSLSPSQLLKVFKLFSNWNLLPSDIFFERFFRTLAPSLNNWNESEFLIFAMSRKINPAHIPVGFLELWKSMAIQKFSSLSLNTKMEVLGAELFHLDDHVFSADELALLMSQVRIELAHEHHFDRLKPLKELLRGLVYLKVIDTKSYSDAEAQLLEDLIRQHLEGLKRLSLVNDSNGSGAVLQSQSSKWEIFKEMVAIRFVSNTVLYEFWDARVPGFYDPVDIFIVEEKLVIEWDGPHHYFIKITDRGDLVGGVEGLILRTFDQAKDRSLRAQGYKVLRIPNQLNAQLPFFSIDDFIAEQNPTP